jgi:N-acetyl-gamma-glutamylphosphate reductase
MNILIAGASGFIGHELVNALKNDYKPAKKSSDTQKQKKREDEIAKANLKELQRNAEVIEASYAEYREELIDETIVCLDEDKQKQFMEVYGLFE